MQIKHLDTNKEISTVYKPQLDISGERHDWSPLINYCMGLESGLAPAGVKLVPSHKQPPI